MGAEPAPTGAAEVSTRLAPFINDPAGSVVIVDFDGTLALSLIHI